jgi:hypothetical protein
MKEQHPFLRGPIHLLRPSQFRASSIVASALAFPLLSSKRGWIEDAPLRVVKEQRTRVAGYRRPLKRRIKNNSKIHKSGGSYFRHGCD